MTSPQLSAAPTRPVESDDVIRRVVRAWTAAYEMSYADFASGIDMNLRTFARRLAGHGPVQAFSAGEVARIAKFMSDVTGDRVGIGDLYDGRISVSGGPDGPLAQLAELRTFNPNGAGRGIAAVIDFVTRRRVA